jgi:tRNA(fMet)-specific endonuclease VapC
MPETGRIALDTSVVVASLRRVPGVAHRLEGQEELFLPLFALGELEYGAERSANPSRQRDAIAVFVSGVTILVPTVRTTQEYGRVKAALAAAGTPIPENDIWIAAMALEHSLPLATRDTEHFFRINSLTILDWR